MSKFFFVCPACGQKSEVVLEDREPPEVKCGDCLMDRTEVVSLRLERAIVPWWHER